MTMKLALQNRWVIVLIVAAVASARIVRADDVWLEYPESITPLALQDVQYDFANYQPTPVQESTPGATQPNTTTAQPQRTAPLTNRRSTAARTPTSGLTSIPYMIGDTGAGTCLAFDGLLDIGLAHPTIACSRLNVSENNTPLPTDRVYYSHRHFNNSTPLSVYQFTRTLDVDRHTVAFEKASCDRMFSVEVRVPFEHRLTSEFLSIVVPASNVIDLVAADEDMRTELANISAIGKVLLVQRDGFALSGGLGATFPTAETVETGAAVSGEVVFPDLPGITMDTNSAFMMQFYNETVYLSPFLSWLATPGSRWFHQGFLQVEYALNPSGFYIQGLAANTFLDMGTPVGFYDYDVLGGFRGDLEVQTLMRLNLGLGYLLCDHDVGNRRVRLTGMAELHYTTTLEDAKLTKVPLTVNASGGVTPLQEITVGNQENRVDILNLATGLVAEICDWKITNGAIVPLRSGSDRGFDFEYNLQVQRAF